MRYSSKGLRWRGDTDKWEVTLAHKDPLSGNIVRSYHTMSFTVEQLEAMLAEAKRKKTMAVEAEFPLA